MQKHNVANIAAHLQNSVIGHDYLWLVYMATAACKGATQIVQNVMDAAF